LDLQVEGTGGAAMGNRVRLGAFLLQTMNGSGYLATPIRRLKSKMKCRCIWQAVLKSEQKRHHCLSSFIEASGSNAKILHAYGGDL
jgi:hypothetical protein